LLVQFPLEAVADDVGILGDFSFGIKTSNQGNIERRGSLDVDVVFQSLIQHKAEMGGLSAVAVRIFSLVIVRLHRIAKIGLGILDAFRNLRQIGQFERRAIGFDDLHQIDSVEKEFIILYMKLLGRKIKRLLDQVNVSVHLPVG
jgi:hypothetical protein